MSVIEDHLDWLRLRNLSPKTIEDRRRVLRRVLRELKTDDLLTVESGDLASLQRQRWKLLAPQSHCTYVMHLRSFYRWAGAMDLSRDDPTSKLIRPKIPRRMPRPISETDLSAAIAAADQRMRTWLTLAAYQGLRASEVAGLQRQDLLEAESPPMMYVQATAASARLIPLSGTAHRELRAFGLQRVGYLFGRLDGRPGPIDGQRVSAKSSEHFQALGIAATLHQLRHRFGTQLYRQTHDLRLVQEMMGHASVKTTAVYTAFAPGAAVDAMRGLDALAKPSRKQLRASD